MGLFVSILSKSIFNDIPLLIVSGFEASTLDNRALILGPSVRVTTPLQYGLFLP